MNRALEVGQVTAGLPALTPTRRFDTDRTRLQREESRRAMLQALEREAAASCVQDGDIDTASLEAQMGRPMTFPQLQQRLLKCNHMLHFERAKADPTKAGIYVVQAGKPVFVIGAEFGHMPEFSIRHVKIEKVAGLDDNEWHEQRKFVGETRGWRTVLAKLLRKGLITVGQIEKYFNVTGGRSSQQWQTLTT